MTWQDLRDRILFSGGIFGILVLLVVWVVTKRSPDPSLMLIFGTMAGLPTVLSRDEGRK